MSVIKTSISNTLQANLPPDVLVNAIAPLLVSVNEWSTQIPAMLEGNGPSASANLVFAIRKDLFGGPPFSQTTFGIATAELPQAFQDFMSFIRDLIEAQKVDREKPVQRVSNPLTSSGLSYFIKATSSPCVVSGVSSNPSQPSRMTTRSRSLPL